MVSSTRIERLVKKLKPVFKPEPVNMELVQKIILILDENRQKYSFEINAELHSKAFNNAVEVYLPFIKDGDAEKILTEEYDNYVDPQPGRQRGEYKPRSGDLKFTDFVRERQLNSATPTPRY